MTLSAQLAPLCFTICEPHLLHCLAGATAPFYKLTIELGSNKAGGFRLYVVTGGAGFIGSNIVAGLEANQAGPVVVVDRLGTDDKWRNIAKRELEDVVAPEDLFPFLNGRAGKIEAVIHMGAISSTVETNVDALIRENFHLSLWLWQWCSANGVPLIYASSAATYGDGAQGFRDDNSGEALAQLRPLNPYGWSKHLFDRRVARIVAEGNPAPPKWAGLKFFNVYGPNEYHKGSQMSVVANIFSEAKSGRPVELFKSHHPDYADGGQMRDFVWVDDCVAMVLGLLKSPAASGIYNCGTGKARSFADLAATVFAALGKQPAIHYVPTPQAIRNKYQYFTQAENTRNTLGIKAWASLEEGVKHYVHDFLNNDDPYR
jgi:ADP-L-glycero-D-manno-heptose 6-epimerase